MARFEFDVARDKTTGKFVNLEKVIRELESENEKLRQENSKLRNRTKIVDMLQEMLTNEETIIEEI